VERERRFVLNKQSEPALFAARSHRAILAVLAMLRAEGCLAPPPPEKGASRSVTREIVNREIRINVAPGAIRKRVVKDHRFWRANALERLAELEIPRE